MWEHICYPAIKTRSEKYTSAVKKFLKARGLGSGTERTVMEVSILCPNHPHSANII